MKSYQNGPYDPRPFRLHLVSVGLSVMIFSCFCVMLFHLLHYHRLQGLGSHLWLAACGLPLLAWWAWQAAGKRHQGMLYKGMQLSSEGFTLLGIREVYVPFSDIRSLRLTVHGLRVLRHKGRPDILIPRSMESFGHMAVALATWQARHAEGGHKATRGKGSPSLTMSRPARWKVVTLGLASLAGLGVVAWYIHLPLLVLLLLVLLLCAQVMQRSQWGPLCRPLILALLLAWVLLAVMECEHLLPF
ncbi:hypothetical protein [Chitinophaga costaii]|nr:hypothetical protein [Chitinophaga costaii]